MKTSIGARIFVWICTAWFVAVTLGGLYSLGNILLHAILNPWATLRLLAAFVFMGSMIAVIGEMLSGARR